MNEEPKSLTQLELNTHQLRHYQRIHANCWVNESPEVQEEVLKVYDAEHNSDDDEEENDDNKTKVMKMRRVYLYASKSKLSLFKCDLFKHILIY